MYAYIDSFRKFGKTNTDNQSIKIKRPYPARIRLFRIRMCCGGPAQASCGVPVPLNRGLSILLQRPEVVACDGPAGILPHADLHTRGGAVGRSE